MKAIILVGGKGLRLNRLTSNKPKCMVKVKDKPLIEHGMEVLSDLFEEIIVVVGEKKEQIMDYLGGRCSYIEQKEALGTAHAVGLLKEKVGDKFLVINGDVLVKKKDIKTMISKKPITIAIYPVEDPWKYGVMKLKGKKIIEIIEKPVKGGEPSNLINGGVYLFDRRIFDAIEQTKISKRGEYEITDSLNILIKNNIKINHFMLSSRLEITTPEDLLEANKGGW